MPASILNHVNLSEVDGMSDIWTALASIHRLKEMSQNLMTIYLQIFGLYLSSTLDGVNNCYENQNNIFLLQ